MVRTEKLGRRSVNARVLLSGVRERRAAAITPATRCSPAPSRSCFARSTSPSFAGRGGFKTLPSRAAKRSGRGRPTGRGRVRRGLHSTPTQKHPKPAVHRPPPDLADARSTSPSFAGRGGFKTLPSHAAKRSGRGRPTGRGRARRGLHSTPYQLHPRPAVHRPPPDLAIARSTSPSFAGRGGFKTLPSRAAKRSGRGRPKAGGGPAAACTQRRTKNTRNPLFTGPLPILLRSIDLPQLRWGRRVNSASSKLRSPDEQFHTSSNPRQLMSFLGP